MTQEDKELLFKDLSSRLPYGVKCWASYNKFPTTLVDVNADTVGDNLFVVTVKLKKTGLNSPSLIEDIKPYLRPMSSMTDEQKKYIVDRWGINEEFDFEINPDWGEYFIELGDIVDFIDWLNKNHFDYRGLIEKGLAIEAPKDMYKNQQ